MVCLSLLFDKRERQDLEGGLYYFVDVKEKFYDMIPDKIKKLSVFKTQNIKTEYVDNIIMDRGETIAKERLREYYGNAKMIITSKLHCMCPCIAMGIPTIAVNDNFSYRYSFLDAYINSYDVNSFALYDWDKINQAPDIEWIKELMVDVCGTLLDRKPDMEKIKKLDDIYTNRQKWNYCSSMKRKVQQIFDKEKEPEFILWGASAGGHTVFHCIRELYPACKLVAVVDSFGEGIWEGLHIQKPEDVIAEFPSVKVIVSTMSGMDSAEQFLLKSGRKKDRDFYFLHESI